MRVLVGLIALIASCLAQSTPHIAAVVSGADFSPGIALGGFATIFGSNLSDAVYQALSTPYPTTLGPTQAALCPAGKMVAIQSDDCQSVQLVYVSPTQVNFLVPVSLSQLIPGVVEQIELNGAVVVSVNGAIDDGAGAGTNGGPNLGFSSRVTTVSPILGIRTPTRVAASAPRRSTERLGPIAARSPTNREDCSRLLTPLDSANTTRCG